jgi:2-oxoglutarate ferredoxin oxidoreductase subunit gamma
VKKPRTEKWLQDQERYEVRFSGSGGQGIILATVVLAEAAGVYGKKYVAQTQSYGPEARGGASQSDIVISPQAIDYPKAMKLDLLVAMDQTSCDAYFPDLKQNGLLLVDSTLVHQIPTDRAGAIAMTQIARKEVGRELVANMVALGAVGQITKIVSPHSLEAALKAKVPKGTEEMNLRALRAGIQAAKKVNLNALPETIARDEEEEV